MEAQGQNLVPTTHSLLRPDQIEEMVGEKESLEKKLASPVIQDKGAVHEQLRRIARQLKEQSPRPFEGAELDRAVKREAELRETIRSDGMLSHEEMRKSPPGAVDRHRSWEGRQKKNILEWQNLMRRLDADSGNRESASIENFRPTNSSMNMDGALIPGRQFYGPTPGAAPTVTFNSEEIALIQKHAPEVAIRLALLGNEQRAEIKAALATFAPQTEEQEA